MRLASTGLPRCLSTSAATFLLHPTRVSSRTPLVFQACCCCWTRSYLSAAASSSAASSSACAAAWKARNSSASSTLSPIGRAVRSQLCRLSALPRCCATRWSKATPLASACGAARGCECSLSMIEFIAICSSVAACEGGARKAEVGTHTNWVLEGGTHTGLGVVAGHGATIEAKGCGEHGAPAAPRERGAMRESRQRHRAMVGLAAMSR